MEKLLSRKKIHVNECGKIVVAKNEGELKGLDELLKRGKVNGVEVYEISETEAKKIEPSVKTCGRALWSSTTASVNPKEIMKALVEDAKASGIQVLTNTSYKSYQSHTVSTNQGSIEAGFIINAAGLYADKIARDFGFSQNYQIIPFKGLYLYSSEPVGAVKTNIYPVPDLNYPFLGVHYTITADGHIKIGPTAIPSFWREHYTGVKNFHFGEFFEIVGAEAGLFLRNDFQFRNLALTEIKKYSRKHLVSLAQSLLEGVKVSDYKKWGPPGIRAQLLNIQTKKLEMDFRFEGDKKSFHILNAVSSAFTCAIPFCEYLFDEIERGS